MIYQPNHLINLYLAIKQAMAWVDAELWFNDTIADADF